jgi:hypothetical protein
MREIEFEMPNTFEDGTDYLNNLILMMFFEHRNPNQDRFFVVEQTLTKKVENLDP